MLPRPLDPIELRVLGALLEKAQTTPDNYPLTVNSLISACNQKSNRDPVMALTETDVYEALSRLRPDVLVWNSEGARTERWQENLTERLKLKGPVRALITVLLLRGPQTPGELRARTTRMYPFDSLSEIDDALRELTLLDEPLVTMLPRQPGRKERRWAHLMGTDASEVVSNAEAEQGASYRSPTPAAVPSAPVSPAAPASIPPELEQRIAALEEVVEKLRETVERLSVALE